MVCSYDTVVEDILDVGLVGELLDDGVIVFGGVLGRSYGGRGSGDSARVLDGGDSKTIVALEETGTESHGARLGVTWNRTIAVDDDVAVRDDAVREGLRR